ncbi:MAG: PAC2 family protein [Chloroflexi bacterium]|nr:PAC2 family protein [Chloroflexota bacterium]
MANRIDDNLTILERPRLREPYLIAGFAGWLDGGGAAVGTVEYLIKKLKATRFAHIDPEDFHVYQVPGVEMLRPFVKTEDGVVKIIQTPSHDFYYWKNPKPRERDIVILSGIEPNIRWNQYLEVLLEFAQRLKVKRIYSVGGVLGGVPHTRKPQISCSISEPKLREALSPYGVKFSGYTGPGTFQSYLLANCREYELQGIQLTARAFYYPDVTIGVAFNPRAIHALLQRLASLANIELDLSDLLTAAKELEEKLDAIVGENAELQSYVKELESQYTEVKFDEPLKGRPEDFVRDAEEFLKRGHNAGDS